MSERWTDEDLLEWLLDPASRAGRDVHDPRSRARLAELESFVATCRAELPESPAAAVPGGARDDLAQRILERTTREDLSLRGDLRLLRGFLGERLRSSTLLRVAAASLLVHFAALPVLAYFAFFAPEPQVRIGFVPWEQEHPPAIVSDGEAPVQALSVPAVHQEPQVREVDPTRRATPDGDR